MGRSRLGAGNSGSGALFAPLSAMQSRLWMLTQFAAGAAYCSVRAYRICGPLEPAILRRALSVLIQRHDELRCTFPVIDGVPTQKIVPEHVFELVCRDLGNSADSKSELLHRCLGKIGRQSFDIGSDFPYRFHLLRVGSDEHVFVAQVHWLLADESALAELAHELFEFYAILAQGQAVVERQPAVPYHVYARREAAWMETAAAKEQERFWLAQYRELPPALELNGRRRLSTPLQAERLRRMFDLATLTALQSIAESQALDLTALLLCAWQLCLLRHTNADEIVVGLASSNRHLSGPDAIGNYGNYLPIRLRLHGNPSFVALAQQVAAACRQARSNGEWPISRMLDQVCPDPRQGQAPLFQTVLHIVGQQELRVPYCGSLGITPIDAPVTASEFDIRLQVSVAEGGMLVEFAYRTDRLTEGEVAQLAQRFANLLAAVAERPALPAYDLPLLDDAERESILACARGPQSDGMPKPGLLELFARQVLKTPTAIAASCAGRQMTYQELDNGANRIARHLRTLGVGPEVTVGVCMQRGLNMLLGMLGILKAGGAYVPLDPNYPDERLALMLEDATVKVVLVDPEPDTKSLPTARLLAVPVDLDLPAFAHAPEALPPASPSNRLAYVLYTSGSTGRPKGVMIEHCQLSNLLHWGRSLFPPEEPQVFLASTSICFDISVFELFLPLVMGGEVLIVENLLSIHAGALSRAVTYINAVPSVMSALLSAATLPEGVVRVGLAGEPLQAGLVSEVYAQSSIREVMDFYGPTETTVYATGALRRIGGPATIGRAIADTQVYILDPAGNPVPPGVTGELYIGGAGVARGYCGRPGLTAERFVPDVYSGQPGARMYRTGDVGRYLADGSIELAGRSDQQVKIRGFRIELGEIEQQLLTHPEVREAVVVAVPTLHGEQKLVAYYSARSRQPEAEGLRKFLSGRLPQYMVPGAFFRLPELPRTLNGKVDRRQLRATEPKPSPLSATLCLPQNDLEEQLLGLWQEILQVQPCGTTDDFCSCGGDVRLAVNLLAIIKDRYGVTVALSAFFQNPTVCGLAERLRAESPQLPRRPMQLLGWVGNKLMGITRH